jgi:hypothetical protein
LATLGRSCKIPDTPVPQVAYGAVRIVVRADHVNRLSGFSNDSPQDVSLGAPHYLMSSMRLTLVLSLFLVGCVAPTGTLPARYYHLMEAGLPAVEKRLDEQPNPDFDALEAATHPESFPSPILAAAVLYTSSHPANSSCGNPRWLSLAQRIGDLLATESEKGRTPQRIDHRELYLWLETYRLLTNHLGEERRSRWRREIERNVGRLAVAVAGREHFPRYQSPFIRTSSNHYALWGSTVYLAGLVLENREWEELGGRVMRRFSIEEQTSDGYWGEHSDAGPTTGYNYITFTGVALYAEHSGDPTAVQALRRGTDFHMHFTWPDGMPVEVINDRNRHWEVDSWGHFGFSRFSDGRRYAEFLTGFFHDGRLGMETLGRIAQNALYFHEGPTSPIPQDLPEFAFHMKVPAGIRKRGPWTVALSALTSTQPVANQFYLDRQGHLSIFHQKLGLIVSGANSKRQPELATFSETVRGHLNHLPISSALRMEPAVDRLSLAYNTFFADLTLPESSAQAIAFRFAITEMGRVEGAQLALQLVLRPGELLETAKSRIVLGANRLELGPDEIGGLIRHHGWSLRVDPSARLVWPVYPFSPYTNASETELGFAVGLLTVPIQPQRSAGRFRTQDIRFMLEVAG